MIRSKPALAAALLFALSASDAVAERQWVPYEPAGWGFRVELPGQPTVKDGQSNSDYGPVQTTYASTDQKDSFACTVRTTTYLPGITGPDPQAYLSRSKQNFANKFAVRSEERFTMGTAPAIRFIIDLPDKSAKYLGLLVQNRDGDRAIVVVCTFPKGQENSRDVARVFNSFAFSRP